MKIRLAVTAALLGAGCYQDPPPSHPPLPRPVAEVSASASASVAPPPDVLGARPIPPAPPPFTPPSPTVYTATNGITVWLLERHNLPLVSLNLVVPSGSAADPKGKEGLAFAAGGMLSEGAGKYGAIELARAVDMLGASLASGAEVDGSYVSMTVLKRNLGAGLGLFADTVARPRFDPGEWKRVHELWLNALKARASEPSATARLLYRAAIYGKDHPYGHTVDGTAESANRIQLDDARRFYQTHFRPDRATLVVVGDVTRDELAPLLDAGFAAWKAPKTPPPPAVTPPAPAAPSARVVMIDRPDAPQAIIAVVRPGVAASDANEALLSRVNTPIGGGFTSRLNQDLREEHNWSYGAGSRVGFTRGPGVIVAQAAVETDKATVALRALLADLDIFAKKGLTGEEVDKSRSQERTALVSVFETVDSVASRLSNDAMLGLEADHEATASLRRDAASKADLDALAAKYFDPRDAVICIVGPKAHIDLSTLGLPKPEMHDADGKVLP